jgi:hypothetical protein
MRLLRRSDGSLPGSAAPRARRAGRRRGLSYLDGLAAVLLLSLAAAGAYATWRNTLLVTQSKRRAELECYIGTSELDRIKAVRYQNLPVGTQMVSYYDAFGGLVTAYPAAAPNPLPANGYKTQSTLSTVAGTASLEELVIDVYDTGGLNHYEHIQTLFTKGGT